MSGHSTIYFENKVYMFSNDKHSYVYDKRTNKIEEITEKVKGELLYMAYGTSTVVNDKVINTGWNGT